MRVGLNSRTSVPQAPNDEGCIKSLTHSASQTNQRTALCYTLHALGNTCEMLESICATFRRWVRSYGHAPDRFLSGGPQKRERESGRSCRTAMHAAQICGHHRPRTAKARARWLGFYLCVSGMLTISAIVRAIQEWRYWRSPRGACACMPIKRWLHCRLRLDGQSRCAERTVDDNSLTHRWSTANLHSLDRILTRGLYVKLSYLEKLRPYSAHSRPFSRNLL